MRARGAAQKGERPIRTWHEPIAGSRIPLAGLLSAIVATGANLGLLFAGRRWLEVPTDLPVLSPTVVIAVTCGTVFLGSLVLGLLGQTQARPFTIFRRLTAAGFVVACAVAVVLYLGWLPALQPVSYVILFVLVGMNAVTALVTVAFLTTMPRDRTYRSGF